eukprot:1185457-Prymnesium_polylepis.1
MLRPACGTRVKLVCRERKSLYECTALGLPCGAVCRPHIAHWLQLSAPTSHIPQALAPSPCPAYSVFSQPDERHGLSRPLGRWR